MNLSISTFFCKYVFRNFIESEAINEILVSSFKTLFEIQLGEKRSSKSIRNTIFANQEVSFWQNEHKMCKQFDFEIRGGSRISVGGR